MAQAYKSKWIISAKEEGQNVYEDCALIIEGGKILDIIPQQDFVEEDFECVEDFGNAVITPGFVNLGARFQYDDILRYKKHTVKGFFLTLKQFFCMLGTPIDTYPMKLSFAEKKYMCIGAKEKDKNFRNGLQKALAMGNTCVVQISKNDKFLKNHFNLLNKLPMKTFVMIDLMADSKKSSKKLFFKVRKLITSLKKKSTETLFLGIYAHSIWSVHKRLWRVLGEYSRRNNLLFMTELLESVDEKELIDTGFSFLEGVNNFFGYKKIKYPVGVSVVEYLKKLKVLNKNFVIQNGNYLSSKELSDLAENGVKIAYSPVENEKIHNKSQKFDDLLRTHSKNFGFMSGCEPLAESEYSILNEMFSSKTNTPVEELIKYATIYPAKILGLDKVIGSLDFNKDADFNVFELGKKQKDYADLRYNKIPKYVYIKGCRIVENGEIVV